MIDIETILFSDKNFTVLSDFLAPQEIGRFIGILEEVLKNEESKLAGISNLKEFNNILKPIIVKALQNGGENFGISSLIDKFNIESFLQQYFIIITSRNP